jgi:hypothetical protein
MSKQIGMAMNAKRLNRLGLTGWAMLGVSARYEETALELASRGRRTGSGDRRQQGRIRLSGLPGREVRDRW